MITQNIKKLNTTDIYSTLLFVLYKIKDIPNYGTLSELVYILDKQNLLKLCEYFGGMTITIPTIDELEVLTYCLIVYNAVALEGKDYEKTLKELPVESHVLKQIRQMYIDVQKVLDEYTIVSR